MHVLAVLTARIFKSTYSIYLLPGQMLSGIRHQDRLDGSGPHVVRRERMQDHPH